MKLIVSLCPLTTKNKLVAQPKKAKDAISYNDFSPVETTQHENPPFLPGFFVLKASINETKVARYVSDVFEDNTKCFIVRFSMWKFHLPIPATNNSYGSLFAGNMYIGRCWAHGCAIAASTTNTSHWNHFGSIANGRHIRRLEWSHICHTFVSFWDFKSNQIKSN